MTGTQGPAGRARRRAPGLAFGLAAALLALLSCQADPSAWYPEGRASIASFYEVDDGLTKSCRFVLKIENTGSSRISRSTVSLEVPTGLRSYFTTMVSNTGILPGGAIFEEGELGYETLAETNAGAAAASIISAFYE